VTSGRDIRSLDPKSFTITCRKSCKVLPASIKRYEKYMFFVGNDVLIKDGATPLLGLYIDAETVPQLEIGVDESYSIVVNTNSSYALIKAETEWGALRGLETFSQMVEYDYHALTYNVYNSPITINDVPRFPYRGMMLDTSRHYFPVKDILRQIDALSFNKFNVFHWHITDDNSFPLKLKSFPYLSEKGSFSPKAVYSADDVKNVIAHAHERGVIVIPEFDTPGHSASWHPGYPDLFPTSCDSKTGYVFDVTKDYIYAFIKTLIGEAVSTLFTSSYFHMGGDEVGSDCWKSDPSITDWMKRNNIGNYTFLQAYFEQKLQDIMVNQFNKKPIFWEEVYSLHAVNVNPNTIVHVWFSSNELVNEVARKGYKVLYSSSYYLDRQAPDPDHINYAWIDTWKNFYHNDPIGKSGLTPDQAKNVLGGETCMWAEAVDKYSIDSRVWPRASAVAERLWSPASLNNAIEASGRLGTHRCRMVNRGIRAGPIHPDYCFVPGDF